MVMIWMMMMMMMVMMIGPCLVWQTSDEAVSDLSSLSDDSANDRHAFEDQIAQAVVSKVGTVFTQLTQSSSPPGEHKGVNKAPPPRPVLGKPPEFIPVLPCLLHLCLRAAKEGAGARTSSRLLSLACHERHLGIV